MDWLFRLNEFVNSLVWGPFMMILLMGSGILLTVATKGVQFRRFAFAVRQVLRGGRRLRGRGTVSPLEALATSLSATVGVGNIAGVSIAIATGGPGAVFWMVMSGVVGMATKFAEIAGRDRIPPEARRNSDARGCQVGRHEVRARRPERRAG